MTDHASRLTPHVPLLILVGLTGTGKSTTVNALRNQGFAFRLLPNRRELTDQLIIPHMQELAGEPVAPVPDRTKRFTYSRRYRELYPGGMAQALEQLTIDNCQLPIVNEASSPHHPITSSPLHLFDGLRGENEVTYAAQHMPEAWFLFLDAPDFVRVQRLLRRNDDFDQVMERGKTAVSLDPAITHWLDDQQLAQLEYFIRQGELALEDVQAKLTIVQQERQNYDPDATLSALRRHAPTRLLYADTTKLSPDQIAQIITNELDT